MLTSCSSPSAVLVDWQEARDRDHKRFALLVPFTVHFASVQYHCESGSLSGVVKLVCSVSAVSVQC
jgi:hypothetical protein